MAEPIVSSDAPPSRARWLDRHAAMCVLTAVLFAGLYLTHQVGGAGAWPLFVACGIFIGACLTPTQVFVVTRFPHHGRSMYLVVQATAVTWLTFQTGWGSLFAFGFVITVMNQIDRFGASVWRPALAGTVATVTGGHLLAVLGVFPTNVTVGVANAAFGIGVVAICILSSTVGTSREQVEAEILARTMAEARFRSLVENSHEGVTLMSADGEVTWASPTMSTMMGLPIEAILSTGWLHLVHPDDSATAVDNLSRLGQPRSRVVVEVRGKHGDGTWHWWECTAVNRLDDPAVAAIVCNIKDITESRIYQDRLAYAASRDSLTGLLNRPAFLERLDSALARARRKDNPAAVLFLDLDDFKSVNDEWGHQAGDVLLQTVATRLLAAVRPGDTVGRLGGDEFVVLLEDLTSPGDADIVADRIQEALRSPLMLDGKPIAPSASIGIAETSSRHESADELLHAADLRMYLAKQSVSRRPRRAVPTSGDIDPAADGIDAASIEAGLFGGEFFLEYQPVVDLNEGRATGVEALVRWNHPQRGRLAPDAFLPQVEALGQMPALGRRVLEEACSTVAGWTAEPGLSAITLAVNASVSQLRDPGFAGMVRQSLAATGLPAARLVIEVTESLPVTPQDQALASLAALAAFGVKIALDDFGAGHASLAQLDLVSAHIVKLDRQLITRIESADGFLQGLIDLLLSLGVDLVAEGIETAEQQAAVAARGIRFGQGYHLARPCSAAQVVPLLQAWKLPIAPEPSRQGNAVPQRASSRK